MSRSYWLTMVCSSSASSCHNEGGEIEFSLPDQLRLLGQFVDREPDIQPPQIGVLEELAQEIGCPGAFGTDPDRCSPQIAEGEKLAILSPEKQQRLGLRKAAQQHQARIGRHGGYAVLHQGESRNAMPLIFGQASDVLDRACRRHDDQLAVFLFGPRRQASGERVVMAARSPARAGMRAEWA